MDVKEYRWHVNLVRSRYEYLKLTFEQAEQVYQMEQVLDGPKYNDYFTEWERLDFELATMRRILSASQLANYLPAHAESVAFHAQQISDANSSAELPYYQECLRYYREIMLPTIYSDFHLVSRMSILAMRIGEHRLQFVWEECDRLLQQEWHQTVMHHYRHYRDLAGPALEKARLLHEMRLIWPNYRLFTTSLYKPARHILKVALRDHDYMLNECWPRLTAWEQEWAENAKKRQEDFSGPTRGWVQATTSSEKQRRRYWLFQLLWLSRTIPPPTQAATPAKRPRKPKVT